MGRPHVTRPLARLLHGPVSRLAATSPASRTSTPLAESLAIGLGCAPTPGSARRGDLPEWQR